MIFILSQSHKFYHWTSKYLCSALWNITFYRFHYDVIFSHANMDSSHIKKKCRMSEESRYRCIGWTGIAQLFFPIDSATWLTERETSWGQGRTNGHWPVQWAAVIAIRAHIGRSQINYKQNVIPSSAKNMWKLLLQLLTESLKESRAFNKPIHSHFCDAVKLSKRPVSIL